MLRSDKRRANIFHKSHHNFSLSRLSCVLHSARRTSESEAWRNGGQDIFSYLSCLPWHSKDGEKLFVAMLNLKYACAFAIKRLYIVHCQVSFVISWCKTKTILVLDEITRTIS